ncbi:SDR family NAD(P)-dependent oxidoreductase, partial [Planococcus sp. SIMBA_143]
MNRLQNKTAVITGAATGIRQATVELFAKEGATVLCADVNTEEMNKTADKLNSDGANVKTFHVDVSSEDSVTSFANKVKEEYGTIDVLFNNAG